MTRIDPERAKVLPAVTRIDTSVMPPDMPAPNDLVVAAGDDSRYRSLGLGEARMYVGGSPRHWFFLSPSQRIKSGLSVAEFGITNKDMTGDEHEQARFTHELAIDADLALNSQIPSKREMFDLMGGMLVDKVRRRGDLFYAGLEIRYKQIRDDEVVRWTQIVFSRALLGTQAIFQKALDRGFALPDWGIDAAKPQNRNLAAENMAISALIAARRQS